MGTKSYVGFVAGYVKDYDNPDSDIFEMAKELKINKPSRILDVNIALFNIRNDSALFKVNFYSIRKGLPHKKLGSKNIIIEQRLVEGWNKFDLKRFDLRFDQPVFISLEYIPKETDEPEPFRYSGQLFGKSIKRSSSLGEWSVKKGLRMALYATVEQ